MSRVAVVGCGVIAPRYVQTLTELGWVEIAACADGLPERAEALAASCGAKATTLDDVLADPDVDAVVNLTPPTVHAKVSGATLAAGKATFSEKPLGVDFDEGRALVDLAVTSGVRLGCAPDTFLGAGLQAARAAIDRGDIGEPVAANAMLMGFGPEWWHPGPEMFYARGAGPMLDMGPYYLTALVQLLGPARSITASAHVTRAQRTIRTRERRGETFPVEVPTYVSSVVEMASGVPATLVTSFDALATRYRNIEVYGTEATLSVPDPNTFGGPVQLRGIRDQEWREVPLGEPNVPQERGIGLADMLWAQRTGRPHRCSSELALHVLDLMTSALASSEQGRRVELTTTCARAEPMRSDLPANAFDD